MAGAQKRKAKKARKNRNKRSNLLGLPAELRLEIYTYALTPEDVKLALDKGTQPGIIETCKLFRKEALETYSKSLEDVVKWEAQAVAEALREERQAENTGIKRGIRQSCCMGTPLSLGLSVRGLRSEQRMLS